MWLRFKTWRLHNRLNELVLLEIDMDFMACPVCGYIITEFEYTLIKCDPKCPRCGQETFSKFLPSRIGKLDVDEM